MISDSLALTLILMFLAVILGYFSVGLVCFVFDWAVSLM